MTVSRSGHRVAAMRRRCVRDNPQPSLVGVDDRSPRTNSCRVSCLRFQAASLVDVRLPGLSGFDLHAELTKANIQIPIIFITDGINVCGA